MSGRYSIARLAILAMVFGLIPILAQVAPPAADTPDDSGATGPGVARISLLNGDVSVRRGDSGDYVAAALNAPVMTQDSIQTGPGARAEVQFDNANLIRLAQGTEVNFTNLQNGIFQMQLGRGTVTFRVLQDVHAQVEVDTPSVAVKPSQPGIYRITVTDDGQTYVTPRNGEVEIYTPHGAQVISAGQTLTARGSAADPEYQLMAALGRDEWDDWSDNRDRAFQQAVAENAPYVSPEIYGTDELAGRGRWVNTPDYGYAWTPYVAADWSPYTVGRWGWEDYYGWTWISADPWGWAPYHYGRWFHSPGFGWCWWPGGFHEHHFWRPAVVGFFGFGGGGGGFGFGRIGWVPLAPYERFSPWWGRGLHGGSHVVLNNVNIVHNTNISNIYRNARIGNGAVAVNAQQFGRGGTGYSRISGNELRSAGLVHGNIPVTPTSQAMRFTNRSTGAIARTNFSQTRFASHIATPATSQRAPFAGTATTPRTSGNAFGRTPQVNRSSVDSGSPWNRFGQTGRTSNAGGSPAPATSGSWTRFGTPRSTVAPGSSAPGSQSYTGSTGRYRGSNYGSGNSGYTGSAGRSQLQVAPPLVRERGYSAPAYNAPRNSAPQYNSAPRYNSAPQYNSSPRYNSAPQYSAPRYSAPAYSAPRYSAPSAPAPHYSAPSAPSPHYSSPGGSAPRQSAPSGGGGRPSGGSVSRGGGGGGHRR